MVWFNIETSSKIYAVAKVFTHFLKQSFHKMPVLFYTSLREEKDLGLY
jgi:hypothetical protein